MGCTHSGLGQNGEVQSFRVYNVNDQGDELHRGVIEIRDGDLVLYQKGKNPIRWPLRCLRRYGYDAELFSFESGRRCAMGPGIYAFKCARAEELFNLVQDSIQRAGGLAQPAAQQHQLHTTPGANGGALLLNRQTELEVSSGQRTLQSASTVPQASGRNPPASANGAYINNSHLYVNGTVAQSAGQHEYTNTSIINQNNGAFQIDEAAALVDFLHNPPGMGSGRSQVNHAEVCMPDNQSCGDLNSPDADLQAFGQGADHRSSCNMDLNSRAFQPGLAFGGQATESHLQPFHEDLVAGAYHEVTAYQHHPAQSDGLHPFEALAEEAASTNYVNITMEESGGVAAAGAAAAGPTGPTGPTALPPAAALHASTATATAAKPISLLPPTHDKVTNYANLALQPPKAPKANKQVNYILIDHKNQNSDNASGGPGNGNNSPISPTGLMPFPESPSQKTESYATIDFDRTVALSNATRPVEDDEGGRKTRHNSTIEGIP